MKRKINLKRLHEMMTGGIAGIINPNSAGPYGNGSQEEGVTRPRRIRIIRKSFPVNQNKKK